MEMRSCKRKPGISYTALAKGKDFGKIERVVAFRSEPVSVETEKYWYRIIGTLGLPE